jgi:23S rRNA (cytidine1920-2'-O)/16S rRNA (cytidine1409-2'-O)-methyltransferase
VSRAKGKKPPKLRLDQLLVDRGLFPTRTKAQAAVMAGKVRLEGVDRPKAGQSVSEDAKVEILEDAVPFVSRGGLKLQAALDAFPIKVEGRVALDLGASTGGFTDCLLQRGAAKVYAVDVGTAQLDDKLRKDPRVVSLEKTHAKDLTPKLLGEPAPDLLVCDVSFISLTKVLEPALAVLAHPCELVLLVKPQFELEPKKVPKGVVREQAHRDEAVERVRTAAKDLGLSDHGLLESPAKGPKGNLEYLLFLKRY